MTGDNALFLSEKNSSRRNSYIRCFNMYGLHCILIVVLCSENLLCDREQLYNYYLLYFNEELGLE